MLLHWASPHGEIGFLAAQDLRVGEHSMWQLVSEDRKRKLPVLVKVELGLEGPFYKFC